MGKMQELGPKLEFGRFVIFSPEHQNLLTNLTKQTKQEGRTEGQKYLGPI